MRSCFLFIAFIVTLKLDGINSADSVAKSRFPTLFLEKFPNPDDRYNIIVAPFAFRNVLLLSSLVAKKKTQAELKQVLFNSKIEDIYKATVNDDIKSKMRLYVNKYTNVSKCVQKLASDIIEYVDFSLPEARESMDAYVDKSTNGILPHLYINRMDPKRHYVTFIYNEVMDLLWQKPFQDTIVKRRINGTKTTGTLMRLNDTFMYGNMTDLGVEAVELPLTNGAKILVLQPYNIKDRQENFVALKKELLSSNFREISRRLKPKKLSLLFPQLTALKMERQTLLGTARNVTILLYTKYLAYEQNYLSLFK